MHSWPSGACLNLMHISLTSPHFTSKNGTCSKPRWREGLQDWQNGIHLKPACSSGAQGRVPDSFGTESSSFRFKLKLPSALGEDEGDSEQLIRDKAVERGILALPGTAFYPNGKKSAFVRAAFSLLSADDVDEGLRRLAEVVRS
jgi:hypothetical protein